MEQIDEPERPKAILYEHAVGSLADLRQELEQILSTSFEFSIGRETGGAGTPYPALEVILIFATSATTAIITSVLNELGKDVYKALKGKLFKKPFEKDSTMDFSVTIVSSEVVTKGTIRTDNFDDVIEVMKNVKELFDNSSKINVSEVKQVSNMRIWGRDKQIIDRGNFFFHYEYDASEAKWVLKKIAKIEKGI
ncbi:MAG TPA: hypothetical protein VEP90_20535 [Methylomirabilota bacterium]|nr:hypothetical protein [Methylomirabilota bacterium]